MWTLANYDNSQFLPMHLTCSPRVVCWIATRREIGSACTKKASDYSTKRLTTSTNSRTAIDSVRILTFQSFATSRSQTHIQNSQPKRSWRWSTVPVSSELFWLEMNFHLPSSFAPSNRYSLFSYPILRILLPQHKGSLTRKS